MKCIKLLIFFLVMLPLSLIANNEKTREELLDEESKAILKGCEKIAAEFYSLEVGQDHKEITNTILQSTETPKEIKDLLLSSGRRFFLFTYPSDGLQVKGYVSFVPNPEKNPLLILLRGGNRIFGLMHPATPNSCLRNYTVLATVYRGGVSEGKDEYGGADVNDVYNLTQYFPQLQQKIGVFFKPESTFILGGSRGGMEMFLTLGRFPSLQQQIKKAVSLSGLLDIGEGVEDLRDMFIKDFGLIPGENEEEWKNHRSPLAIVPKISKDLPFLILQGTDDLRVSLKQGYQMVEKLKENGNPVTYIEVPGGDHCLRNQVNCKDIIADWLEQ